LAELAQHGAFARIMDSLGRRQQRLDELAYRLETALRRLLEHDRRRWEFAAAAVRYYDVRQRLRAIEEQLESRTAALAAAFRNALLERKSQLERLAGSLLALSPLAILERGYALVFDSSGKLIKDPDAVRAGDDISARVAKGEIRAVVKEKRA
jgi:exodeoxyribonuclease VII large subunit